MKWPMDKIFVKKEKRRKQVFLVKRLHSRQKLNLVCLID